MPRNYAGFLHLGPQLRNVREMDAEGDTCDIQHEVHKYRTPRERILSICEGSVRASSYVNGLREDAF
jgi:hypothetical protein